MNGLADEEITIYEKITGRETKLVNRVTFNTEYNSLNIPEKRTFKDESNPNISEEEIFSLDNRNRTTQITKENSDAKYTYYKNGLVKSETLPNGIVSTYEYDGSETLYSYDSMGNRTQKSVLKDGITTRINYTYDTEAETGGGLVRRIIAEKKTNGELSETTVYNFDKNGSMIKKTVKNAEGETLSMFFDNVTLSRLVHLLKAMASIVFTFGSSTLLIFLL